MTQNRLKVFAIVTLILPMLVLSAFWKGPAAARSHVGSDPAAVYKAKCAMCHSPKAEKFFDPAKAEDELINAVLKGKKGEKPPYMPGYEEKGMTPEEAKALVDFMKGLRTSTN